MTPGRFSCRCWTYAQALRRYEYVCIGRECHHAASCYRRYVTLGDYESAHLRKEVLSTLPVTTAREIVFHFAGAAAADPPCGDTSPAQLDSSEAGTEEGYAANAWPLIPFCIASRCFLPSDYIAPGLLRMKQWPLIRGAKPGS